MSFSEAKRREVWNRYYASLSSTTDVFGNTMSTNNFEVDHIWPESRGGRDAIENLMPLSSDSNQEKSDDLSGRINGNSFSVERSGIAGIGVLLVNGQKESK